MSNVVKASLHNHSIYSGNSASQRCTLERMIEKAFDVDLQILAITDNNSDRSIDLILANSSKMKYSITDFDDRGIIINKKEHELCLIRGAEIFTDKGHILSIGHEGKMCFNKKHDLFDILGEIKDRGGLAIPAHILHTQIGGMKKETLLEIIDYIDAVETFNAYNIKVFPRMIDATRFNLLAKKFSQEYHIPGIASSDSHHIDQIDRAYVLFNKDKLNYSSGKKFVDSIRTSLQNNEFKNYESYVPKVEIMRWILSININPIKKVKNLTNLLRKELLGYFVN
ncbi:MAG: hypothetical protein OH363_03605 [Candidatus Parvarchaeota archaeon]|nr:hypothetical protein [Candidatus Jingweiarchaeum tengchongense]